MGCQWSRIISRLLISFVAEVHFHLFVDVDTNSAPIIFREELGLLVISCTAAAEVRNFEGRLLRMLLGRTCLLCR